MASILLPKFRKYQFLKAIFVSIDCSLKKVLSYPLPFHFWSPENFAQKMRSNLHINTKEARNGFIDILSEKKIKDSGN